jgi:cell division protein ZapA
MENRTDQRVKATVQIYGEEYIISGQGDTTYIEKLAAYVDKKMQLMGNKYPQLTINKVAVLAALNIAEELSKLQEDYDTMVNLFEEEKALK